MKDAFEALSQLTKLGKKTKEIEIEGQKILLSTLDSEKEALVFVACSSLSGNAYFFKLKSETIKFSICAVNDIRLDEYQTIKDPSKKEQLKNETLSKLDSIIGTWDENIVSYIYSKWVELSKESEDELKKKGLIESKLETTA